MTFPTMKTFKKNSEMPANNQCAEIFDLACELHVNPANRQSHMNVKNLTSSTSEVTSPSNPICTDSHLYDTAVNRMFTLDSDYFKRPQFQCLPNCQDIPLSSEEKGLINSFPIVGHTHPRIRSHLRSHIVKNSSHTANTHLSPGKLENKSLPFLQTVPHFIYINNPNNQLRNEKEMRSPMDLPNELMEPIKASNEDCEYILENSHIVCPNPCVNSSSSQCECNRKHGRDCNFNDILFNSHPIHYPSCDYQCHSRTQLQTRQDYSLKGFIVEEDKIKCGSNASSLENYESGEKLTNSKTRLSKHMKCCHRLTMTLVCVLIFTCLCYRIIDYFNRYEMMKSLFVYNKYYMPEKSIGLHNNRSENFKSTSKSVNKELKKLNWFTITLCNLNPMRGSALFTVQNGSQIYDMVSRGRQNEIDFNVETVRQASRLNRISIELLKQTGHKLTDMLKYCHTGNERCTFQNFTSVLTTYGQCYRMKLERSVHEVSFVLDSQDYDYIIPHRGLVGFRLWIHASEKQAYNMLDLKNDPRQTVDNDRGFQLYLQQQTGIQSNEIIVSTEFQTLIRVALDMNVRLMQNNLRHLCSTRAESVGCENDERDGEPHKDSLGETIWLSSNNYQDLWNARIVSATQSSKASMMYSLLSLRNPNLFVRNKIDLERGLRIQQRAYIQLVNETAFNELRNLVSSYEDLRNQLGNIKQLLHEIEIGFWRDQREALQMTHTDITCSKMVIRYFETLINITRTFQDDLCGLPLLDAFYTTSLFDCHNYTQPTYSSSSINDYRGQVNITSVYQFPSHAHLSSWLQVNYPHRSNRTLLLHDQINNIDKNVYDMINNPALLELQVIQLFFSNATNSSKLKDILRKYLKLLSAKRMQMTTRTSSTRYGLSLGSHLPTSSSSVTSSLTSSPSSPSSTSSDASSITSSSLSSSSASSASTSVLHSFRFPERVNSLTLSNDDPKELLCSSQIQIHIDSIYNVKLEKLGENIATCLQRLESFQTSMNLIIQWNKPIIKTFSIDVEHSQKLNEANLVTFTIQIEKMEMGISMTQLTPMYKIFSPFGEIMGICFGTLSLLIPICLTVDYCFSMKCKSSPDRHEKSIP